MTSDFCMTSPVTDNVDVDTIGNCGGAGLDIKPKEGKGLISSFWSILWPVPEIVDDPVGTHLKPVSMGMAVVRWRSCTLATGRLRGHNHHHASWSSSSLSSWWSSPGGGEHQDGLLPGDGAPGQHQHDPAAAPVTHQASLNNILYHLV